MLRYVRIAVMLLCLAACVLLVALWVRSGWRDDVVVAPVIGGEERLIVHSIGGFVVVNIVGRPPFIPLPPDVTELEFQTQPAAERVGVPALWLPRFFRSAYQLWLPLWIPAVAFAVAGVFTWCAPDRWWPRRFSLRTLLAATAVAAVLLSIIAASAQVHRSSPRFHKGPKIAPPSSNNELTTARPP
jgi:hypothetical protein